jgi:hypothetical protein
VQRYRTAVAIGVLSVGSYLFLISGVMVRSTYNTWAAYVLAPVFFLSAAPLLSRMLNKVEPDRRIHRIVIMGLAAKLIGGFLRFATNEYLIGHGDAENYYLAGSAIAAELRSFVFGGPAVQFLLPDVTGTRFIRLLTALVYVITGSTNLGGYVVFSFISFWGLYLFYRAYCIAMPDGLRRRYAILVFFLPSVVFWPSSIGKEAWMLTMLGLGSYGLARLLTYQRFGYLAIVAAVAGMGVVRPHVAAIFGAGLVAAFVLRRTGTGGGGTGKKILGLLFLAIVAGLLLNQLQSFFELEDGLSAQQVFDETNRRSSTGDAQFESSQPTSPAQLPWAIVTVLFRPFLFEASNPAALVTAVEGTVLLALFLWNLPRLIRLPTLMVSRPYVGYAVVYTLIFAFAFSAISNFGILARQRTQLFPIVVIVLTVPFQSTLRTRRDIALDPHDEQTDGGPAGGSRAGPPPEQREALAEPADGWRRPLPYQPVGAQGRYQRAEPEGGQRQRWPARSEDPARIGRKRPQGPKPLSRR